MTKRAETTNIAKYLSKEKPLQVRNYASCGMFTSRDSLATCFYLELLTTGSKRKFNKKSRGSSCCDQSPALETNGNTLLAVPAACLVKYMYLSHAVLGHCLEHFYCAYNYFSGNQALQTLGKCVCLISLFCYCAKSSHPCTASLNFN